MLIDQKIVIPVSPFNRKKYPNNKLGELIEIQTSELSYGSVIRVNVKCEYCGKEKKLQYSKWIKNTKNKTVKYSCSNKCSVAKYIDTCMEKYGVENTYQLEENKNKMKNTCIERYGVENPMQDLKINNRALKTRIDNGYSCDIKDEFFKYRNKCRSLTYKVKNILLENWDGFDFYDNEYIKNNFNLNPMDRNYPTIEHKIPLLHGYLNKISETIVCDIENLCFTKRWINSTLGSKLDKRDKFKNDL